MSKKILALLLAFALVFSTMTVAFAEETTISEDAQIVTTIGMLKGTGPSGVTDEYLKSQPTRMQAAIMMLRLKGLEDEALAYTGTDNFSDGNIVWTGGRNIMAYLKAHPELGWVGDQTGKFYPNSSVTAQQYYKVMLEALGYKQEVDFFWSNVFEFAASKGLLKVAAVEKFTVNDLSIATVEALKANVKDTSKSLIATLVDAGKVDRAKAIEAGIYADSADAALSSVIAIANDKVEVTFDSAVAKAFAENASNYKVVVKGSSTALEAKSAVAVSDTVVEITTAAQTAGTAYTLTVDGMSKNFAGIAKVAGAPALDTVKSIDTNVIEVKFTKALDKASAETVENYTLNNGATVKKAELWTSQDETRKTVRLTTEGVANNKIYNLKVQNVKSADMVALNSGNKNFAGTTDTKAPTVTGNIIVKNNQRILVNFSDAHGIDKASAENLENWSIDGLTINSIVAKDEIADDYDYYDQVEINTEPMDASRKYTLTINNLVDGSSSENVIASQITKYFYGVSIDKTAPKAGAITVYGDSMVEIQFTETNRLDVASATDISNYTFTDDLQVLSASILRPSKPDTDLGKTVVLTTSAMDKATTYKLSINNVADEFGNVIAPVNNRSITRSQGPDIKPPTITKTVWNSLTEVQLTFDERLDEASANDPANYSINKNLGTVIKAEVQASSGYKVVKLTTARQAENTSYTITVNGVTDRVGNPTINAKAYFTSAMEGADTNRPEIESITALSDREIRVTFDEAVEATVGAPNMTVDGGAFTAIVVGNPASNYTVDDERTVVLMTSSAMTTDEITITSLTGISDKHGNKFVVDADDQPTFYGSNSDDDPAEVNMKSQLNMRTLQFEFSEPVLVKTAAAGKITASNGTVFDIFVDVDSDTTTDPTSTLALSTVTLVKNGSGILPYNTEYKFDFSGTFTDYLGNDVTDEGVEYANYTTYTTYMDDQDNPAIDYVEATSIKNIKVVYNEEMSTPGSYQIQTTEGKAVSGVTTSAAVDSDDKTVVNVTITSGSLVAGDVYRLVPKTSAKDIAGNSSDIKDVSHDFVASAVTTTDYIKGISIIDGKTIKVEFTKAMTMPADTLVVYATNDETETNIVDTARTDAVYTAGIKGSGTKTLTVVLKKALMDDVSYTVKTTGSVAGSYAITGRIVDGGLEVEENGQITFSGWEASKFVVYVVYNGTMTPVVPADAEGQFVFTDADFTAAGITTDANYTIEVYRANATITGYGDPANYNGDTVRDSAVLYSREFTK